jgi:hypothetical protein
LNPFIVQYEKETHTMGGKTKNKPAGERVGGRGHRPTKASLEKLNKQEDATDTDTAKHVPLTYQQIMCMLQSPGGGDGASKLFKRKFSNPDERETALCDLEIMVIEIGTKIVTNNWRRFQQC